jgi:lia operon protein LiaF
MSNTKKESLFWGLIILVLGMLFLLKNFGLEINIWHLLGKYWPLILVYIGVKNIYLYLKKNR